MERTNPMEKKLFSFENYLALIDAIKATKAAGSKQDRDIDRDTAMINRAIRSFTEYVKNVDDGENHIRVAAAHCERDEFLVVVEATDKLRHGCHEAAISHAAILNRVASFYGVGDIFLGSQKDRYEVADFCLDVTTTLFQNREK